MTPHCAFEFPAEISRKINEFYEKNGLFNLRDEKYRMNMNSYEHDITVFCGTESAEFEYRDYLWAATTPREGFGPKYTQFTISSRAICLHLDRQLCCIAAKRFYYKDEDHRYSNQCLRRLEGSEKKIVNIDGCDQEVNIWDSTFSDPTIPFCFQQIAPNQVDVILFGGSTNQIVFRGGSPNVIKGNDITYDEWDQSK